MKRNTLESIIVTGLLALGISSSHANPTGGQVVGGAASINTVPGTVTINQQSNIAIINWQTFSIGAGELTKFVQPSSTSAALNRVLGGQTSLIDGTLSANGRVYLVNGNGIIVGPGGIVCANSFTASTRDIADSDFVAGKLHFTGSSSAGVQNLGKIHALGGDVYLIGKTVDNQGSIRATKGTVGLAAGDDVLLAQQNADGSTITVSPSSHAKRESGKTAVSNTGTITATNAELKAANGNLYALAINNGGTIRATTVSHQGGHIYLTSDSGTVVNSGTLDASATVAGGKGGIVSLKNAKGTTTDSGKILAKGGQGGAGGNAEVSGTTIHYTGLTDLTAPGGTTGTLVLDPFNITIQDQGPSTTTNGDGGITVVPDDNDPQGNDGDCDADDVGGILTVADLENTLATASVYVYTGIASSPGLQQGNITVKDPITWNSNSTLILSAAGSVFLNADITAPHGTLGFNTHTITSGSANAFNPAGVTANINVGGFILISGNWIQNSPNLPTFQVGSPLVLGSGNLFLRSGGGAGTTADPYHLVDSTGIQGIPTFPAGTVYVIGFNTNPPPDTTLTIPSGTMTAISSFDAYTANPPPPFSNFNFSPTDLGNLVSVDNPDGDGGAVNDGSGHGKKGTNIASGSSTSGTPAPNRLLTAGSGINSIFQGSVNPVQPSAFVLQKIEMILGNDSENELNHAVFGTH
jgi:filamentous hemagglutinin family protein